MCTSLLLGFLSSVCQPSSVRAHCVQVLHQVCHNAMSICLTAVEDHGASWLRLGVAAGILQALASCR